MSEYQWVDLRREIAEYERRHRPFPPLKGSVSKPARSCEPETEAGYFHAKFAEPGEGERIMWRIELEPQTEAPAEGPRK